MTHLDERHGSVWVVDGLHYGLRRHQVGNALCRGQVVLRRRRGGRDLLVLKGVEQVLAAVLLVAVLDDGPQGLSPGHLPGKEKVDTGEISRTGGTKFTESFGI